MIQTVISITLLFAVLTPCIAKELPPASADVQAQKSIALIAKEFQKSKTVREWIDKAPRKVKIFRRVHFSEKLNEPMPMVLMSKNKLVIIPKNKKAKSRITEQHLLEAKMENGKIAFYLDKRNISRNINETLDQWYNRLYKIPPKPKKTAHVQSLFVNVAHAEPLGWDTEGTTDASQRVYWSALAASMSADEWQDSDQIAENSFAAIDTSSMASDMAHNLNLTCDSDKKARFDFEVNPPVGGYYRVESFMDRTTTPPQLRVWINNHPNSGMPSSGQQVARLAVPVVPENYGRSEKVYSFDHRGGSDEHWTDPQNGDWTLGRVFYAMEVRHPGETADVESRASFKNFQEYMVYAQELLVMADVANAVCTNRSLQQESGVPSGTAPVAQ